MIDDLHGRLVAFVEGLTDLRTASGLSPEQIVSAIDSYRRVWRAVPNWTSLSSERRQWIATEGARLGPSIGSAGFAHRDQPFRVIMTDRSGSS